MVGTARRLALAALAAGAALAGAGRGAAQSFNFDFGAALTGPPATYAAAGRAGFWNAIPAAHGSTTTGLVDVDGGLTGASLRQIGGLALLEVLDPAISGDDALLMHDFLVTYDAGLESCIFLEGMQPGTYEVLIYARMPDPFVLSYTSVDQEPGVPYWSVGGFWPGAHAPYVSYSRHLAQVDAAGWLYLHSGIVPGADPLLGAALNGLQVRLARFVDGFESGDVSAWSSVVPRADPSRAAGASRGRRRRGPSRRSP
jgi:hypothetical protein